jgi:hypothetical protein
MNAEELAVLAIVESLTAERDTLRKAYDLSNATNSRLVAQIDGLQKAEKETGEAYLRLREILGAFRTPHGPTCEQVWAHTEDRARELQAQVGRLRDVAETPAQPVAHIEAAAVARAVLVLAADRLKKGIVDLPRAEIEAAALRRVAAEIRHSFPHDDYERGYDDALDDVVVAASDL